MLLPPLSKADRDSRREMGYRLLAQPLADAMTTMVATKFSRWKAELVGLEKAVGVNEGKLGVEDGRWR